MKRALIVGFVAILNLGLFSFASAAILVQQPDNSTPHTGLNSNIIVGQATTTSAGFGPLYVDFLDNTVGASAHIQQATIAQGCSGGVNTLGTYTFTATTGLTFANFSQSNTIPVGVSYLVCLTIGDYYGNSFFIPYFVLFDSGGAPINWSSITASPPFTLGTTTTAIAASSSLWGSLSIASSSLACGTESITDPASYISVGICQGVSFLFIPAPTVLQQFAEIPNNFTQVFPFSWVYGFQAVFDNFEASSSENVYTANYNLASLPLLAASTSIGNVLPNVQVFGTTTIEQLMPTGVWNAIQSLLAASMWISLGYFIWRDTVKEMHRV